ncbi:hypothetical protein, partial [Segatella copri]|uniref:hypothetical protein n=1 Tax=Segatella copri TaxID=165179 RepID=UPI002FF25070
LNIPLGCSFYLFLGDQRWNRWGRGREGGKALLPFYLFTFLPLKAFWKACGARLVKLQLSQNILTKSSYSS